MTNFFCYNMDFVHLIYGTVFFLLGWMAYLLQREDRHYPWRQLCWFGSLQGLHQWLDLAAFSWTGETAIMLHAVRFLTLLFSFLFLLDFGLSGFLQQWKAAYRWCLYAGWLGVAYGLFPHTWEGLNGGVRLMFGVPGALVTGYAFWRGRNEPGVPRRVLMGLSGLLALFAMLSGIIPREANYFFGNGQADILFRTIGVPVQVFRLLLGISLGIILWRYYRIVQQKNGLTPHPGLMELLIGLAVLLVGGSILMNYGGRVGGARIADEQSKQVKWAMRLIKGPLQKVQIETGGKLADGECLARKLQRLQAAWRQYGSYRVDRLAAGGPSWRLDAVALARHRAVPISSRRPWSASSQKGTSLSMPYRDRLGYWMAAAAYAPTGDKTACDRLEITTEAEPWLHETAMARFQAALPVEMAIWLWLILWGSRVIHTEAGIQLQRLLGRTRGLLEAQNDLIVRLDAQGQLTFVNEVFCIRVKRKQPELLGRKLTQLPGFSTFAIPGEPWAPEPRKQIQELTDSSGTTQWIEWDFRSVADENGRMIELQGVGRDVTALQTALQALIRSEQEYRQLAELAGEGLWMTDAADITIFVNRQMAAMLGTEAVAMLGQSFYHFVPAESRELLAAQLAEGRRGPTEPRRDEFVFRKKNGEALPTRLATTVRYDERGNYAGMVLVAVDISRFREMKEKLDTLMAELKNADAFKQAVLDIDPNIILVKDEQSRILLANQTMANEFGISVQALTGKIFTAAVTPCTVTPAERETDALVRRTMQPYEYDAEIHMTSGSVTWFRVVKAPFRLLSGKVGLVTVAMNITTRKQAEMMLTENNRMLEDRVRERTQTLKRTISQLAGEIEEKQQLQQLLHEESERIQARLGQDLHDVLGQTLTAIALKATCLSQKWEEAAGEKDALAEQIVKYANEAVGQMRNIARMLSSINLERYGLEFELAGFRAFVIRCFEVEMTVEVDSGLVAKLTEETRKNLFRIIQESVMNGIRHGKAGRIDLHLIPAENPEWGELTIRNDGTAIDLEHPGEGIGLQIMKTRAEVIGATLEMDNCPDGGVELKCRFGARTNAKLAGA